MNNDLYVNPTGNNNNSGLSPSEPPRTISCAIIKILADSLNPRNIYLANGIYSPSTNGENYPLYMHSYISLIGESEPNVIIDAEDRLEQVIALDQDTGVFIKNMNNIPLSLFPFTDTIYNNNHLQYVF